MNVDSYQKRKQERKKHFEDNVMFWKEVTCTACSGTGYYDSNKSPKCDSCNGTGKKKAPPEKLKVKTLI